MGSTRIRKIIWLTAIYKCPIKLLKLGTGFHPFLLPFLGILPFLVSARSLLAGLLGF